MSYFSYPGKSFEIEPEQIIQFVDDVFNPQSGWTTKKSRRREVVVPRQFAMYFIHKHTRLSLSKIGYYFNQPHNIVIYSCGVVENTLRTDRDYKDKYEKIVSIIDIIIGAKLKD